jgi:hypothetical protein
MRRRNAAMHALLNDNGEDDLLCMQEPWFNPVGMARCDNRIQGKDVLGGAANPRWRLAYPSLTNGQRAKVMTYVRLHNRFAKYKPNHCQMIVRNDLASHPCLLISDIRVGTYYWRVINFYNDVADLSALDALVDLDLDATIPTLLVGDFNLHSPSWSPTGWDTSRGAHRLEEWAAAQTLELLSNVTFFLLITVHITDYHWDRHSYFVIHSHHAQTMTHTPPSDDSILILRLVVLVACDSD